MNPSLHASLYSLLVAAALLGSVVYGYLAWQVNGDTERALWKGVGALVVLLVLARVVLWLLRPWGNRPLEGDVLHDAARRTVEQEEHA